MLEILLVGELFPKIRVTETGIEAINQERVVTRTVVLGRRAQWPGLVA
ncbi:MAG: hypothetical protein KDI45_04495 [Candidatus Accumulibacter sp.]|nr:hypothetical protein [Accumulibacter sp.]MCB1966531.1 hypothetical protein [Accumulibacter sp.]